MSESDIQKYSEEEWNWLCKRFHNSILNETEIAKLGQNVSINWPFKGTDETPAKYMDYTFDEIKQVPGLIGKFSRVKLLMDIMRETLAFDDPFGEMVATVESESHEDDTFKRILEKLGIPADYPAEFLHFTKDTKGLLKNEEVTTLIECVHFGQNLARNVVIGGDLKTFLNSLAHKDEKVMAKHMPYRRGEKGLHLAEAIGLICEDLDAAVKLHLLKSGGITISEEEQAVLAKRQKPELEEALQSALEKVVKVAEWFKSEAPDLEHTYKTGGSPDRFFISLNDPRREKIAVELSRLQFTPEEEKKSGFFGRLLGR